MIKFLSVACLATSVTIIETANANYLDIEDPYDLFDNYEGDGETDPVKAFYNDGRVHRMNWRKYERGGWLKNDEIQP